MTILLGVDVGGTFTDFLLWEDGRYRIHKRPSTPSDPARAVLDGVDALGVVPARVVHGSTVATNTVLERSGARTALVTTAGMRDLLRIGRQTRPDIYALEPATPEPLIPGELSMELHARLGPDGAVEVAPDHSEIRNLVRLAEEEEAEALAVSLLYSYANPAFERLFEEVAAASDLYLSLSSVVSPEYREVERTGTTVLNAYVGPVMSRYLHRLRDGLQQRGVPTLRVVQSDGGSAEAAHAADLPVATLLSGPAAGAAGAFAVAQAAGFDRILTFDMGGTSTDVALCDGAVPSRPDVVIDGIAARTPVVDVHTVGAGGGSIARLDAGGALHVGPQSTGADPGPACYGRGTDFAVTDAHVVLGRLGAAGPQGAEGLLGGEMPLVPARAQAAIAPLLPTFGGDAQRAAAAVLDVAVANMERALRVVSVQRGHDPRDFTLVAFGGAGPLHAADLATVLDVPRVLIPAMPGVLSALGAVTGDLTATRTHSVLRRLPPARDVVAEAGAAAEAGDADAILEALAGVAALATAQVQEAGPVRLLRALDLRYAGQSYELTIEVEPAPTAATAQATDAPDAETAAPPVMALHEAAVAFHRLHEQRYGHSDPDAVVEVVNVRATARVSQGVAVPAAVRDPNPAPPFTTQAWFDGVAQETVVRPRDGIDPGETVHGPAIVTQVDTTTIIPPRWQGSVDAAGNLLLERP